MMRLTQVALLLLVCLLTQSTTTAFEGAVSVVTKKKTPPPTSVGGTGTFTPVPDSSTRSSSSTALGVAQVTTTYKQPARQQQQQQQQPVATSGATVSNLSISLFKSIVGAGVLALPACLADLGGSTTTVISLCVVLTAAMGALNAYLFRLMGRNCAALEQGAAKTTYAGAWQASVGKGNQAAKLAVAATVAAKTAVSCLGFCMVLADAGQSMATAAGLSWVTRGQALFAITISTLLPLSLLRDLKSLAPFSALGVGGLGLTALSMMIRAVDGSYRPGGAFFQATALPLVSSPSLQWGKALVLACTLTTAFNAHYNAPKFFAELQEPSVANFSKVTQTAYTAAAMSFVGIALAGYLTFGTACQGFILNNYSAADPLINLSRAALALSIIFTFPLPFQGLRDTILDLWQVGHRTDNLVRVTTLGLLGCIATAAHVCKNLASVMAIGGGTFSTLVSAVFPVIMFVRHNNKRRHQDKTASRESKIALCLMALATGIGGSGVVLAIRKAMVGV